MTVAFRRGEDWRAVPGWPGYQVSDHGRVARVAPGQGAVSGRILRPRLSTAGHVRVALHVGGERVDVGVHRLVALAFIDDDPDSTLVVNHKSGDKLDNRPANLEWVTIAENNQHAWDSGLNRANPWRGEDHPNALLSNEQVSAIRAAYSKGGVLQRELAKRYGVSRQTIGRVVNGLRYVGVVA